MLVPDCSVYRPLCNGKCLQFFIHKQKIESCTLAYYQKGNHFKPFFEYSCLMLFHTITTAGSTAALLMLPCCCYTSVTHHEMCFSFHFICRWKMVYQNAFNKIIDQRLKSSLFTWPLCVKFLWLANDWTWFCNINTLLVIVEVH